MGKWLRRLRGMLGLGAIWGGVGTVLGAVGGAAVGLVGGISLGYVVPVFAVYSGVLGVLLGGGVGVAVSLLEERGVLGELSPRRGLIIGAAAGALMPLVWLLFPLGELLTDLTALPIGQFLVVLAGSSATCAVLGAGVAGSTVALAARAPSEVVEPDPLEAVGPGTTE